MDFYPEKAGVNTSSEIVHPVNFADVSNRFISNQGRSSTKMIDDLTTLQDYGSIRSMDLPPTYVLKSSPGDAGYLNLDENEPRLFASRALPDAIISAWSNNFSKESAPGLTEVMQKSPHALSNDEYFRISGLLAPGGPWAQNGRNHEISMTTQDIAGKRAIVYDYWRTRDMARDKFDAKPMPEDLRGKVVFFPNQATGKVDVVWTQTQVKEFEKSQDDFEKALKSIKWK